MLIFKLKDDSSLELQICSVILENIYDQNSLIQFFFQFFQNSSFHWINVSILERLLDFLLYLNEYRIYQTNTRQVSENFVEQVALKCYEQEDVGLIEFFFVLFVKLKNGKKNYDEIQLMHLQNEIYHCLLVLFKYDYQLKEGEISQQFLQISFELIEKNPLFLGILKRIFALQKTDAQKHFLTQQINQFCTFLKRLDIKLDLENQQTIIQASEVLQFTEILCNRLTEEQYQLKSFENLLNHLFSRCSDLSVFAFLLLISVNYFQAFYKESYYQNSQKSEAMLQQITKKYVDLLKSFREQKDLSASIIQLETKYGHLNFKGDAQFMEEIFQQRDSSTNESNFSLSEIQLQGSNRSSSNVVVQESNDSLFTNNQEAWERQY